MIHRQFVYTCHEAVSYHVTYPTGLAPTNFQIMESRCRKAPIMAPHNDIAPANNIAPDAGLALSLLLA